MSQKNKEAAEKPEKKHKGRWLEWPSEKMSWRSFFVWLTLLLGWIAIMILAAWHLGLKPPML